MITRILAISLALTLIGCRSAYRFPCDASLPPRAPRNFGEVHTSDGKPTGLFRGGQPTDCAQLEYLRSIGVRGILKLNERDLPQDSGELAHAARMGFEIMSLRLSAGTVGGPESCARVREALGFLANADGPVYVHCTAGKDRTGYVIGMYGKLALHKTDSVVLAELRRYGHRGVRALLMPQIDRELRKSLPECAVVE